jgi:hypothetical protein
MEKASLRGQGAVGGPIGRPERSEPRGVLGVSPSEEGLKTKANREFDDFLGDPPPGPRFLASLGTLSLVELDHCSLLEILTGGTGPKEPATMSSWYKFPVTARRAKRENGGLGPVSKSSYFLGDPPPDPRFLASLGALSLVELDNCSVLEILTGATGPKEPATMSSWYKLPVTAHRAKRENGGLGKDPPGSTMTY